MSPAPGDAWAEDAMADELARLLRAGVPARGVHITIRELVVTRFERGPVGAREVSEGLHAVARAACRVVREMNAPPEVVETVCRAALEAVRGHGGLTALWFAEARTATADALDEIAREHADEAAWRWIARRLAAP